MIDELYDAGNEAKRCDHLIGVSLKYTRTVDVLISILKRFISCIDFLMDALYVTAIEEKIIDEVPNSPVAKAKELKRVYKDQVIQDMINDYLSFRRLVRSEYTKRNEFRRYVTMTVDYDGRIVEIDIDAVVDYFEKIKKYMEHIKKMVEKEVDDS